ncbi:hypothetical protein [Methylibium petroleiphilum]|uniref:Uncharacterized protein n=1 Tax=Methylibium petroleiphilum (strain ATCC BAA-1232 / LMG 22953 / PM1) TaxID=420662 RepID=A2SMV2_METPP|nr:hypothetical protein [Methylibium petroleiphilum]ABM96891.1 hypothetical protein Mpe_B0112 [Methylibium petroleiphilum PM1]
MHVFQSTPKLVGNQQDKPLTYRPNTVPRIFIVDTAFGRTVKEYEGDIRSARRQALIEYGTRGYAGIQRATLDVLVEIKRCGGWMPAHVRPAVEEHERKLRGGAH